MTDGVIPLLGGPGALAVCGTARLFVGTGPFLIAADVHVFDTATLSEIDRLSIAGHLLPGLNPVGVPRGLYGTALPFNYNRISELETIVSNHGRDLAAIILEPVRPSRPNSRSHPSACNRSTQA